MKTGESFIRILILVSLSAALGENIEEPVIEKSYNITAVHPEYSTSAAIENSTSIPLDNGMAIRDIREDVRIHEPDDRKHQVLTHENAESDEFPKNHKKFYPSQQLDEEDFPPYYNPFVKKPQKYETFYDELDSYGRKPIKFEENSLHNYYLPQKFENGKEDEKIEPSDFVIKPFPYAFENNKPNENWEGKIEKGQYEVHKDLGRNPQELGHSYYPHHHKKPFEYENDFHHYAYYNDREIAKDESDKSPWKKVAHLLSALVPIGLLLAALTPSTYIIPPNSGSDVKTSRKAEQKELQFKEEDILRLVEEYGYKNLNFSHCQDRSLCEMARSGADASANVIAKGLWELAKQTPLDVAKKAGMDELFKAIKTGTCEIYTCETKAVTSPQPRIVKKKLIRKRKVIK